MGRRPKKKLDYFPMDCQNDDKLKRIIAEFGVKGFGIVVGLFQKIYGEEGYYAEWNEDVAFLFAHEKGVGAEVVSEVIKLALKIRLFDQELFEEYGILTSRGIQKRYGEVVGRRIENELLPEYSLLKCVPKPKKGDKNAIYVNKNAINVDRNTQRKGKERKGKEIKENDIFISIILSSGNYLNVTESSITEWKEIYPDVDIHQELRNMKGWCDANPQKRKTQEDISSFINNWLRKEQSKISSSKSNNTSNTRQYRRVEEVPQYKEQTEIPEVDMNKLHETLEQIKQKRVM